VYRFVLTPRWIGLALLMTLASVAMVGLGLWQLDRYHTRSAVNSRIDRAADLPPVALAAEVATPAPSAAGQAGAAPPTQADWARVTATGRYDPTHEILARERTVNGEIGYEVITPLVVGPSTAVLVDRGWIAAPGGSMSLPAVPQAPSGEVTVVGRVHAPESRADTVVSYAGALTVRRIAPAKLAPTLPYAVYGAYVTLESQTPPANPAFVAVTPDHENAAMNAGYVVQWWLMAAMTLFGYGYLVVREARSRVAADDQRPGRTGQFDLDYDMSDVPASTSR
jgi:cytochrome oxidase assembly protein ShyY1